ncbi:hypothetical protein ACN47E_005773 [Coniothyrium glycines]
MAHDNFIFALPLELREQVYKEVFRSPNSSLDIIHTCRELRNEAYKFQFQRTITFGSRAHLYTWLRQTAQEHLAHVVDVRFIVHDVSLDNLMESRDEEDPLAYGSGRLLTWDLYEADLRIFSQALLKIPHLKRITIRATPLRQSFLYRKYLNNLLEILASLYPSLSGLSLEGTMHHQRLSFLMCFERLESLTFVGFSAPSASETIGTLKGMDRLKRSSLVTQQTMLTPTSSMHNSFATKRQSITGEVMRRISNLTYFPVTECLPSRSPDLFVSTATLKSLHPLQSLTSFALHMFCTPDVKTLQALQAFLESSKIGHLSLDWPEIDANTLDECLPVTDALRTLWIRAENICSAASILCSLWESRKAGELSGLEAIVLIRAAIGDEHHQSNVGERRTNAAEVAKDNLDDGKSDTENTVWLRKELQSLGVHVAWCTENPQSQTPSELEVRKSSTHLTVCG